LLARRARPSQLAGPPAGRSRLTGWRILQSLPEHLGDPADDLLGFRRGFRGDRERQLAGADHEHDRGSNGEDKDDPHQNEID
jgi:hypothetical protein